MRVESWNDVVGTFGPPEGAFATPYALRGFFENGGRTAWVLRVSGPPPRPGRRGRSGR
ncbi:hypothetical protein ACFQ10_47265 [Streptomyces indonesiensis]